MRRVHEQQIVFCWSVALAMLLLFLPCVLHAQESERRAMLGAYYFGGWSGETHHVTDLLRNEFADRKPVWGWETNSANMVQQIEKFVRLGVRWLDEHPEKATEERLLLIYAWNEMGEGGYLTPTAKDGTKYLEAVQQVISVEK